MIVEILNIILAVLIWEIIKHVYYKFTHTRFVEGHLGKITISNKSIKKIQETFPDYKRLKWNEWWW